VTNTHLTTAEINRLLRNGYSVTHIREVSDTHSLCRIGPDAFDWLSANPVEVWPMAIKPNAAINARS
jgi:hypothetical protein